MLPIVELVNKAIEQAPLQATHRAEIFPFTYIDFNDSVVYFQSLKNYIKKEGLDRHPDALSVAIDSYQFLMSLDPHLREKNANFQNAVLSARMLSIAAKNFEWLLLNQDKDNNLMTAFNELVRIGYFKNIQPTDDAGYLVCLQSETQAPAVIFESLVETNDSLISNNRHLKKVADFLKTSYVCMRGQFLEFSLSITKPASTWPSATYSKIILETLMTVPDEFVGKYMSAALLAAARYSMKINDVVDAGLARSIYLNDILFLPRPAPESAVGVLVIAPEIVAEAGYHICYIDIPGYPEPEEPTIASR